MAQVKAAVESDPVDLIETLAQRIADVCLLDDRVEWVGVTVHKPDAPIEATFADVALTITRTTSSDSTVTETPNPNIVDADTLTGEMRPIRRAVLSLGSNLGERLTSLQGAVDALADTPDVWVTGVSPVYETEPVDSPDGSKNFLNAVVLLDTTLAAHPAARPRARHRGRLRPRAQRGASNAPRTLDVDLIVVGDRRADDENLHAAAPAGAERAFVLLPWYDLEPDAEIPDVGADRRAAREDRARGRQPPRRHRARRGVRTGRAGS